MTGALEQYSGQARRVLWRLGRAPVLDLVYSQISLSTPTMTSAWDLERLSWSHHSDGPA